MLNQTLEENLRKNNLSNLYMSSHTYNLRKCIETEGNFCNIQKNYKAPLCPSYPAVNRNISSSSQRTQSLLQNVLKENNVYSKKNETNLGTITSAALYGDGVNTYVFEDDVNYLIKFNVENSSNNDITIALQYNSQIQDIHKVIVPRNSNMRTVEFELSTNSNTTNKDVKLGTYTNNGSEEIDDPTIITDLIISYDEMQNCNNICNDESGNLKKNTLLYNGSYAQYLQNNYNA